MNERITPPLLVEPQKRLMWDAPDCLRSAIQLPPAHSKTKAFGDAQDADGYRVAMLPACDDARGYGNSME